MRSRCVLILSAIVVPCILGHAASASAQSPVASEIELACAPTLTIMPERPVVHALRVVGGQDTVQRVLFGDVNTATARVLAAEGYALALLDRSPVTAKLKIDRL